MNKNTTLLIGIAGTGIFVIAIISCVMVIMMAFKTDEPVGETNPKDLVPAAFLLIIIISGALAVLLKIVMKKYESAAIKDFNDPFARIKRNSASRRKYRKNR